MPKKAAKLVSLKSLKKSAKKVHAANERVRSLTKRQPHEDQNQTAYRVMQEVIRRSESQ